MSQERAIFLLGGTGFIGQEVVRQAIDVGVEVRALARSEESAEKLRAAGARPVSGAAENGREWADSARGASALIDLVQPRFPRRLGRGAVAKLSQQREATTRGVLEAVGSLPEGERPVIFSVSGAEDLEPDGEHQVSHASPVSAHPDGLSRIGVPSRRMIESSGLDATYVYFGALVYGAGKVFADIYVKGMRRRTAKILGNGANRLPLTHVIDAARALVHLAGLPRDELVGRTWVATDPSVTTQRELLERTAELMGARRPGKLPVAVAALVAGSAAARSMTTDLVADPSALAATGFAPRFPSPQEGLPQVLAALGEARG